MSETLRELIALDRDYFVPAQVAEVLGMDAQAIRILGRRSPERLPFPVIGVGQSGQDSEDPVFEVHGRRRKRSYKFKCTAKWRSEPE